MPEDIKHEWHPRSLGKLPETSQEKVNPPEVVQKQEEQLEKIQNINDLNTVLAIVSSDIRNDTPKYLAYREVVSGAKKRLENQGITLDDYLKKGVEMGTPDGNKEFGARKGKMREGLADAQNNKLLSDEQEEMFKMVGIKPDGLAMNTGKTEKEKEIEVSPSVEGSAGPKKDQVDEKIKNILLYPKSSEKRKALGSMREELVRKGESPEKIGKVDEAAGNLKIREEQEIQKYADNGEMRPELKEAMERYCLEIEKKYDSGGNMVNFYQMAPDFELTKHLAEMKELGSDGEKLSAELEKELFDIGVLHDLKLMVNSRGMVDENMLRYAALLKGQQFDRLIHLQNRLSRNETNGNDCVVKNLAAIDKEARTIYNDVSGKKFFELEDPQLESRILNEVRGDRLSYLIARDLYRVTGGEARYGVAGYAHRDENKGWVIEKSGDDNNGAFFRKAMNKRRDFAGAVDPTANGKYVLRYWPELWKHLDPGVNSFWEKLWKEAKSGTVNEELGNKFTFQKEISLNKDIEAGIPPREYAVLTVDSLRSLRLGTEEPGKANINGEINFNVWMDDIGKVANTMSKETSFMGSPNFKSFQSILGAEYFPIILKARTDGRKINREQYLLERLGDLVEYNYASNSMNPTQIAVELEEYRKAGFLFKSESEMVSFMRKYKIPITNKEKQASELRTFGKKLTGEPSGRRQAMGAIGKMAEKLFDEIIK